MKRLVCIVSYFFLIGLSSVRAQQASPKDLVISLEKKTWELAQRKDKAAFAALIADEGQDVGELGIWDKEKSVQGIDAPGYVLTSFSLSQMKFVQLTHDVVVLTYQLDQTGTSDGKPLPSREYISSVWVNRGGKWLNALFQDSPASPSS